jgi:hypothetical protein
VLNSLVGFFEGFLDSEQSLLGGGGVVGGELPGSSHDGSQASLALPDSDRLSLDLVLSAELAVVLGVLRNLVFLGNLSHGSSVSGSVLSDDSLLLGSS